jgi:hypothetical protein
MESRKRIRVKTPEDLAVQIGRNLGGTDFKLRIVQEKVVSFFNKTFDATGQLQAYVDASPGTGKTMAMALLVYVASKRYQDFRAVLVVPTCEIRTQVLNTLQGVLCQGDLNLYTNGAEPSACGHTKRKIFIRRSQDGPIEEVTTQTEHLVTLADTDEEASDGEEFHTILSHYSSSGTGTEISYAEFASRDKQWRRSFVRRSSLTRSGQWACPQILKWSKYTPNSKFALVCSYDFLTKLDLGDTTLKLAIFDEAHHCINHTSAVVWKTHCSKLKQRAERTFFFSGTRIAVPENDMHWIEHTEEEAIAAGEILPRRQCIIPTDWIDKLLFSNETLFEEVFLSWHRQSSLMEVRKALCVAISTMSKMIMCTLNGTLCTNCCIKVPTNIIGKSLEKIFNSSAATILLRMYMDKLTDAIVDLSTLHFHVHCPADDHKERDAILHMLATKSHTDMLNYHVVIFAQWMTEGVDVPGLHGVFIWNKNMSDVEYAQLCARANRPCEGKQHGHIFTLIEDPFIPENMKEDMLLGAFGHLVKPDDKVTDLPRTRGVKRSIAMVDDTGEGFTGKTRNVVSLMLESQEVSSIEVMLPKDIDESAAHFMKGQIDDLQRSKIRRGAWETKVILPNVHVKSGVIVIVFEHNAGELVVLALLRADPTNHVLQSDCSVTYLDIKQGKDIRLWSREEIHLLVRKFSYQLYHEVSIVDDVVSFADSSILSIRIRNEAHSRGPVKLSPIRRKCSFRRTVSNDYRLLHQLDIFADSFMIGTETDVLDIRLRGDGDLASFGLSKRSSPHIMFFVDNIEWVPENNSDAQHHTMVKLIAQRFDTHIVQPPPFAHANILAVVKGEGIEANMCFAYAFNQTNSGTTLDLLPLSVPLDQSKDDKFLNDLKSAGQKAETWKICQEGNTFEFESTQGAKLHWRYDSQKWRILELSGEVMCNFVLTTEGGVPVHIRRQPRLRATGIRPVVEKTSTPTTVWYMLNRDSQVGYRSAPGNHAQDHCQWKDDWAFFVASNSPPLRNIVYLDHTTDGSLTDPNALRVTNCLLNTGWSVDRLHSPNIDACIHALLMKRGVNTMLTSIKKFMNESKCTFGAIYADFDKPGIEQVMSLIDEITESTLLFAYTLANRSARKGDTVAFRMKQTDDRLLPLRFKRIKDSINDKVFTVAYTRDA